MLPKSESCLFALWSFWLSLPIKFEGDKGMANPQKLFGFILCLPTLLNSKTWTIAPLKFSAD